MERRKKCGIVMKNKKRKKETNSHKKEKNKKQTNSKHQNLLKSWPAALSTSISFGDSDAMSGIAFAFERRGRVQDNAVSCSGKGHGTVAVF